VISDLVDFKELKCPYCNKPLSAEEYNHATEEFKVKAAEEYREREKKREEYYNEQIKKQEELHQRQIQELVNIHTEEVKTIRQDLQISSQKQLDDIKKSYAEINAERQKEFRELLEQQSIRYEEEIYKKDMQYQDMQKELEQFKLQALNQARLSVENEMQEKNIQIQRLKEKVESLNKELSKTQSELTGEAGEINLLKKLEQAFPKDVFKTQSRGNSSADIIQYIKTESGVLLEHPIIYDNKEAKCVTRQDIEKAQRYRKVHGTDYVVIVSKNLPNDITEGFGGEKDGVLIVHPRVLLLVASEIRKGLVEISRQSSGRKDQETKQAVLYNYITSKEFSRNLASVYQIEIQLSDLQKKEEKSHQILWKNRDALHKKLASAYMDISSSIDAIIQDQVQDGIGSQTTEQLKNRLIEHYGNGRDGTSS
jgi:hypothetical protein